MSKFIGAIWLFTLLAKWAGAAVLPRAVHVQADVRACIVGHAVAITLQVTGPARLAIRWYLTDTAFAKVRDVTILASGTRTTAGADSQHRVVFTTTQGGRLRIGPFPVVVREVSGTTDTLYAPAITVQFKPEKPRTALHPLRTVRSAWESISYTWQWGAAGGLLLGAGATCWLLWWKKRGAVPEQALTAANARQLALDDIAALERKILGAPLPHDRLPDQLFGIVNNYFQRFPLPAIGAVSGPSQAIPGSATKAVRDALLAELNRARFAPSELSAVGTTLLLTKAKQLMALSDENQSPQGSNL